MASQTENQALIERLYGAFDRGDGEAMAACYAADARFRDPVFGELSGEEAGTMWRMLTSRPDSDLRVELAEHEAGAETGTSPASATASIGSPRGSRNRMTAPRSPSDSSNVTPRSRSSS